MLRVALITSYEERCGIAEYAKNLIQNCPGIVFHIINRFESIANGLKDITECNLVHLNYEPGILGHWNSEVMKRITKPKLLTLHTSHEGNNRTEFTDCFDQVVVHEKTQDGFVNFPMGIPEALDCSICEDKPLFDVGAFGFPFPWKGFTQVVDACEIADLSCLVIIPESRHANAEMMKTHLQSRCKKLEIITTYLKQKEVIHYLKNCRLTAFAYHGGNYGISGAVRMGLATGKPIVVSHNRQFRDLMDYMDEINIVSNPPDPQELATIFKYALEHPERKPKRILEDMSWKKVGQQYIDLYKTLT